MGARLSACFLPMVALLSAFSLSNLAYAQETGEESSRPTLDCYEVSEEEERILDDLHVNSSGFFSDYSFDCTDHELTAEQWAASRLRRYNEEPFTEPLDGGRDRLRVRRLVTNSYAGTLYIVRIDCRYQDRDDVPSSRQREAIGGEVVAILETRNSPEQNGSYRLALGKADCEFIRGVFDDVEPRNIEQTLEFDPDSPFNLHPSSSITEFIDNRGFGHVFLRTGAFRHLRDEFTERGERALVRLIGYLGDRALERGERSGL